MKLVAAAVLVNDIFYVTGHRHADCYEKLYRMGINASKEKTVDGFVDDEENFYNRTDAAIVARLTGQILDPITVLYSEDLW